MEKSKEMSTFIIEREVKNVGNSTSEDLKASSKKSNSVIEKLGPNIKWEQSYIVDDKIYCVYKAKDKSYIKEHAKKVGVPANSIKEVFAITDPQTAE